MSEPIVEKYPLIDEIFDARRAAFGGDEDVFRAVRNHAFRMLNFTRQWIPTSADRDDRLAICASFHDIGVFPERTLDYLGKSAAAATAYLEETGRGQWAREIALMIEWHHKITTYRGEAEAWVEPVRRADWIDVSFGMLRFGLPASFVREVQAAFPVTAFYPKAVAGIMGRWVVHHPANPLPNFRW